VAILHVEDQEVIREVVRRGLEAHGFAVVSVDGVRAAKQALSERDDLAGALLDVRLRDGNGVELYEWIVVHRPSLAIRVAFVTGSADAEVHGVLAAIGRPVLRKPFELAQLARHAAEWESAAAASGSRGAAGTSPD